MRISDWSSDVCSSDLNAALGLAGPTPIPGTNTTGAYSVCGSLGDFAEANGIPVEVMGGGVPVNIRGNQLPQAPEYKFAIGAQYTIDIANGMTLVPRADLNYTGNSYAGIFNNDIDRLQGYEVEIGSAHV